MYNFENKNIIVTGAGGGIGREVCFLLDKLGANVLATDLTKKSLEIFKKNARIRTSIHDVRKESSWIEILKLLKNDTIDGLIQCAGVLKSGYIYDLESSDIDFHIDVNLKGLILGSTLVSRKMKIQRKGHIVHLASLAGLAPIPGISLYSASKFGVRAFSLAMAQEMKDFGVTVSAICPDAVRTNMLDQQKEFEEMALVFSGTTLDPLTIAQLVLRTFSKPKLEVIIPFYRGLLAKIGNFFPSLSTFLFSTLKKIGTHRRKKY